MFWSYSVPCQNPSWSTPPFPCTLNFMSSLFLFLSSFFYTPNKFSLWCLCIPGCVTFLERVADQQRTTLKKTYSPGNYPLVTSQIGVAFLAHLPSPFWCLVWLGLARHLCVLSKWLWVPMCSCSAVSRKQFPCSYLPSFTLTVFCLLFCNNPRALGGGVWYIYSI